MAQNHGAGLLEVMVKAIGTELRRGRIAEIPGLGTFTVKRHPSHQEVLDNGDVLVTPPRNTVVFLRSKDAKSTQ